MAGTGRITVTPQELRNLGEDLKGALKDGLQEAISNIDTKITEICEGWEGAADTAYVELWTELKDNDLSKVLDVISDLGEATIKVGDAFEQADSDISDTIRQSVSK